MTNSETVLVADRDALSGAAAERLATVVGRAIAQRGTARLVLTGGGAGIATLSALRTAEIDWSRVELFWGDERFLAEDDPERNDLQARKALLDHVAIDEAKVHPMPADAGEFAGDVDGAAARYAWMLADIESFDVHLLGMGGEGHVNSIFPHSPAVAEEEATATAVRNCPKPPPTRITLTLPMVRRSREVWLLAAGTEKSEAAAQARNGADPADIPAAGAFGTERTVWFLDEAAARS